MVVPERREYVDAGVNHWWPSFLAQNVGRQPAFLTASVHMTQKTGLLSTSWGQQRCAENMDCYLMQVSGHHNAIFDSLMPR